MSRAFCTAIPIVFASDGRAAALSGASHLFCGLDDAGRTVRPLTEFGPVLQDGSLYPVSVTSYDARTIWITAGVISDPLGYGVRGRPLAGTPGHAPAFRPLPRKIDAAIGEPGIFIPVEDPPAPLATLLFIGTGPADRPHGCGTLGCPTRTAPSATRIVRAFTTNHAGGRSVESLLTRCRHYARNSVHFEFAAGTLAFGAAPKFQTRLVNFGAGDWSDFTERSSVDYLNLPEGGYTFEVRARATRTAGWAAWRRCRSASCRPGSVPRGLTRLRAGAGVGPGGSVRPLAGRQLRRRNAALETLVDTRTSELRGREADLLELVRARDDAESANRAKSAFLANMSHELRTPLNAVLGYTQLLLKQGDLSARSRERIAVIGQSGGHLLSLVNEVLDLSKVEAGKLTLSPLDFSLGQLLDEVGAAFRPRFAEKGLTFTETARRACRRRCTPIRAGCGRCSSIC